MIRLVLTALLFWTAFYANSNDFVVITMNPEMKVLRANQVKLLYRGRVSHVNGIAVRLADLPRDSTYRESFYLKLLNKSPTQMSAIWARLSFSGKAVAPAELSSESLDSILNWLENNANGIAYVPEQLLPEDAYVIYQLTE